MNCPCPGLDRRYAKKCASVLLSITYYAALATVNGGEMVSSAIDLRSDAASPRLAPAHSFSLFVLMKRNRKKLSCQDMPPFAASCAKSPGIYALAADYCIR